MGEGPDAGMAVVNEASEPVDRAEFASALAALRVGAGVSVRELARITGVPHGTIAGYFSGRHLPTATHRSPFSSVLTACGVDDADLPRWLEIVDRLREAPGTRSSSRRSPYPGLAGFQPGDAAFFFGRAEITAAIIDRVDAASSGGTGPGLVAVIGPSGSGKSSILRAGVMPTLTVRSASTGAEAPFLITPGENPTQALITALRERGGELADQLEDATTRPISADANRHPRPLVLIIDQAEELFTLCTDQSERRRFLQVLRALVAPGSPSAQPRSVAILGMRADFYGAAASEPLLLPALQHEQVVVGPLSEERLREVITAPAGLVGVHVEAGLVQTLLDDLAPHDDPGSVHDGGSLPLLAHALRATWERCRRGRMTVEDYQAVGGIAKAVENSAESVWAELDPHGQDLARRILVRLVNIDDESAVTRRRVRIGELLGLDVTDAESAGGHGAGNTAAVIVDRFAKARLLTVRSDTVEISHETFLAAWPRLRGWVESDRAGLRMHRRLTDAADAWRDGNRDSSYLVRGGRLEAIEKWLAGAGDLLNWQESEFFQASREAQLRQQATRQRDRRRLRYLTATAAVLAITAVLLVGYAVYSRVAATARERDVSVAVDQARSRELANEADRMRAADPALAAQLAVVAYRASPTTDALSALLDSTGDPTPIRMLGTAGRTPVALDPRTGLMAVGAGETGSVTLWDMSGSSPVRLSSLGPLPDPAEIVALAVSSEQHLLVTGDRLGRTVLWDVGDARHPVELDALPSVGTRIQAVAVSPTAPVLVVSAGDARIWRWDTANARKPIALEPLSAPGASATLAFTPDGTRLVAGGADGKVRIWDTGTSRVLADLSTGSDGVRALAISPDGHSAAFGGQGDLVQLWEIDGTAPVRLAAPAARFEGGVDALAFSSDGTALAIAGGNRVATVIDLRTGATVVQLPHSAEVDGIVFLPGDRRIVSTALDGTTRVWPLPNSPAAEASGSLSAPVNLGADVVIDGGATNTYQSWSVSDQLPRRTGALVPPVGVSLNGTVAASAAGLVAGGTADGHVVLWDLADSAQPSDAGSSITTGDGPVVALAFSADGSTLAVSGLDRTVSLWDVRTPSTPTRLGTMEIAGGVAESLAFRSHEGILAIAVAGSSGSSGNVQLWDVSDPGRARLVARPAGLPGEAATVAFSPDGTKLAAAGTGRVVEQWDVSNPVAPHVIGVLAGPADAIEWVAYRPDGTELAGATVGGSTWIWRTDETVGAAAVFGGDPYGLAGATWSIDGTKILVSGASGVVRAYLTDPQQAMSWVCASVGDSISPAEWKDYVPDLPYQAPCASG